MVPNNIKEFLSTRVGNAVFAEHHKGESKQVIHYRKKAFLDPPKNVSRWLKTLEAMKKAERKFKKS